MFHTSDKPDVSSVYMTPSTLEMSMKEGTTQSITQEEESVSQEDVDGLEREAMKARKDYKEKKVCLSHL